MLDQITPLLITFDEAANLRRTLTALAWARDIVVVDSGSTDGTLDIIAEFPKVRVVTRAFDTFAEQCNHGLKEVRTEWVLSLDADYVLSPEFTEELNGLDGSVAGYRAAFRYCVQGRPLRASLYPPRTVLYRCALAHYENEGHGHRVIVNGEVRMLRSKIDHDDRKPLSRWMSSQIRYAEQEALHLMTTPNAELNRADRIRRWIVASPGLVFIYTLIARGLILDGWPGWFYVLQRTLAETMLSLALVQRRLERNAPAT